MPTDAHAADEHVGHWEWVCDEDCPNAEHRPTPGADEHARRIVAACCSDPFAMMGEAPDRHTLVVVCRTCGTTLVEVSDGE